MVSVAPSFPMTLKVAVLTLYVVPSELLHSPTTWYTVTSSPGATGTLMVRSISWKSVIVELWPQLCPVVCEMPIFAENIPRICAPTSPDIARLLLPLCSVVLEDDIPWVILTLFLAVLFLYSFFSLCRDTSYGIKSGEKWVIERRDSLLSPLPFLGERLC